MLAREAFGLVLTSESRVIAAEPVRQVLPAYRAFTGTSFLLVVLLGIGVFSWHLDRPGLWRDEAATLIVCQRSLGELFQLVGNLDLVHLSYYLLAQIGWQIDNSLTAVRFISVLSMSLAAGMLVLIGRQLGSVRVGTLAGLLLVVNPYASRYAQEARPFATVTLLAVVSTYLLLGLLQKPTRRSQIAYASSLVLLGLFNVLALMLVLVHANYVWWTGDRLARRRWAVPAVAGLVVITPFVLATFTQRGQVSWIDRPILYHLRNQLTLEFGSGLAPLVVLAAILAVPAVRYLTGSSRQSPRARRAHRPDWVSAPAKAAVVLGAGWAVLPPIVLFGVSQVVPLWDAHYLLFSLPGTVLLLAGLCPYLDSESRLRSWTSLSVAVLLLAGLGLSDQIAYRDPATGHDGENLLSVSAHLGQRSLPGDAVLFSSVEYRWMIAVSPENFTRLDDVALDQTPREAANLSGTSIAAADLPAALRPYQRVWLVAGLTEPAPVPPSVAATGIDTLAKQFDKTETWTITGVRVTLYTRR